MSGARPTHLQRRNGTYHLRVRVPNDLKVRVGLLEVRRSLHVHTLAQARPLALRYAARVMEVFEVVYASNISNDQIKRLVVECFSDLALDWKGGFVPSTNEPELERIEQECIAQELINELDDQIDRGQFAPRTERYAREALEAGGFSYEALSEAAKHSMKEGIARAEIEAHRFASFRVRERLTKYQVQDPLLKKPFPWRTSGKELISEAETGSGPIIFGPTMQELADRYLKAKKPNWVVKTYKTVSHCLDLLLEFVGPETPAVSVTPETIRDLRDGITRFRANHHTGASKTFSGRQTEVVDQRISAKTASVSFSHCTGLFRWAKSNAYLNIDPSHGMSVEMPKGKKGQKGRLPFDKAALKQLFSTPLYQGCKAQGRRFEPGANIYSDAKYWVPLVAYFTGARLSEIIQLQLGDVRLDAEIPHLEISEVGGGDIGSGTEKHVKSTAGIRMVPLHPGLMKLGFGDFARRRQKQKKGHGRLFFEVGYGADGMPSSSFSKWFGRFMDRAGIPDKRLVFHSFRHSMEDALKNAGQPQYVIDRLIGHTDGKVSSEYGVGVSLDVAFAALKSAKLPFDVETHLRDCQPQQL